MKHKIVRYLPVYGCIATGIIYTAIGLFAILSFLRLKDGGADENSLFSLLSDHLAGRIMILIILTGTLCYIIWRVYETINDPYEYGRSAAGLAKRTGIALSSFADILILFSAVKYLTDRGLYNPESQLNEQRQMAAEILELSGGSLILTVSGIIILLTALVQLWYGITRGYHERLEIEEFSPSLRKIVHIWGITGYVSRGIIIGITGFSWIRAGLNRNAWSVVDTDKAFDFIGDNIGHTWFIAVAAGTIFYGLFMFALSAAYNTDKN